MIEMNIQHEQQESLWQQEVLPEKETVAEAGLTVSCTVCEAVYTPASLQVPFLQYTQGALEATFLSLCHFCFRCRRASCPQCWDDVHGVCGACVQDVGLPFRSEVTPLDGLAFPPRLQQPSVAEPQQHIYSLFVPVHYGRFAIEEQIEADQVEPDISTDPTPSIQFVEAQILVSDTLMRPGEKGDGAISDVMTVPMKTPRPEVVQDTGKKKKMLRTAKKVRKASRLETMLTWTLLVIVLALVIVIALAEYFPAVNIQVARLTHIDIHAEIAYLVHIVQQLFKK